MVGKQALVLFVLAAAAGASAASDSWVAVQEVKLGANPPVSNAHFGQCVSLSGDTALVGAATFAQVFARNGTTWSLQAVFDNGSPPYNDLFAYSVSVSGDTAVVGAPGEIESGLDNAGAVYVFVQTGTTWSLQERLVAGDVAEGASFGRAVAVSGDTVLIGASHIYAGSHPPDAAYVFVRSGSTWTEQQKLVSSDLDEFDGFGTAVALAGDTAVIGALGHEHSGLTGGAVYVFERNGTTWSEVQELIPSDTYAFGCAVAISNETMVIGADSDEEGGVYSGSVYAFTHDGVIWSEQQKLLPTDADDNDRFGYSVALDGDAALIGAWRNDHSGLLNPGSAYLFLRNGTTWSEAANFYSNDIAEKDEFGKAVALQDEMAFVGAPLAASGGVANNAGWAYVFTLLEATGETYCTAGTSASGCQAVISAGGTPSASAASGFSLLVTTVQGQKDGLFFFGTNGQQANPWGNGTSYQCVVPPVKRAGTLNGMGTPGLCDGEFDQDLNALWCPTCPKPGHNPGAGAIVQAQLWYRDPGSTSNQTTSLSDAVEFVVQP